MMRSFGVRCFLFCLLLGLLLSAQSCTFMLSDGGHGHGGPPAHAPAHGYRARHSYLYYPSSYVYFDITRKVYFHMDGGSWRMSVSLPSSITINLSEGVSIALDTDRPYRYFSTHKKKYPPGQLKKKYTPGHMKKKQSTGRYKQPPGQTKKQPSRVHRTEKRPPGQTKKQPDRIHRTEKQLPGQEKKDSDRNKETGKDKNKDKGKGKKK